MEHVIKHRMKMAAKLMRRKVRIKRLERVNRALQAVIGDTNAPE
jgi:hypothetical protein